MFLVSAIYTSIVIPTYSYLQMYVEENIRGRVFGLVTSILNIAAPIGVVLFGVLIENHFEYGLIIGSAIIVLFCSIYMKNISIKQKLFKEE